MTASGKVQNRVVTMAKYPEGAPVPSDFGLTTSEFDLDQKLEDGALLLQNCYVTCDPYMRGRMRPGSGGYGGSYQIGDPIVGYGLSKIVKSANPTYKEGWFVSTVLTQWADYQVLTAAEVKAQEGAKMLVYIDPAEEKRDGVPLAYYVGPLGTSGITAWVGLHVKGKPKKGETVFVSAAAGAVGQSVAIFAKEAGCRVVGSAGGADKCKAILEDIKIDAAVDYKNPEGGSLVAALKKAAPNGIDVYFDNVGGDLLQAALEVANNGARMPICGQISKYNDQKSATLDIGGGLTEAQKKIIADKQIDYAPFSVRDHRVQYFEQAVGDMRQQISKGLWKNYKLDVRPGIENAGAFYCDLMKGGNKGKAIVQIRDPRA